MAANHRLGALIAEASECGYRGDLAGLREQYRDHPAFREAPMSTVLEFQCDACGNRASDAKGWAHITLSATTDTVMNMARSEDDLHVDYCKDCWRIMQAALPRPTKPVKPKSKGSQRSQ